MDAFYGEIRIFGFSFTPENWSQCNGQAVNVQQYQVLYTILGTQFGGNGQTTFNLPNLQGSAVFEAGTGLGLTPRLFGHQYGASSVTLTQNQLPNHQHTFHVVQMPAAALDDVPNVNNTSYLARTFNQLNYTNTDTYDTTLSPQIVGIVGGSGFHENRQPYLAMNFCICMYGDYPVKAQ